MARPAARPTAGGGPAPRHRRPLPARLGGRARPAPRPAGERRPPPRRNAPQRRGRISGPMFGVPVGGVFGVSKPGEVVSPRPPPLQSSPRETPPPPPQSGGPRRGPAGAAPRP